MKKVNLSIEVFAKENEQISKKVMNSVRGGMMPVPDGFDTFVKNYETRNRDCCTIWKNKHGVTFNDIH